LPGIRLDRTVYPLGGRVTIDGRSPGDRGRVILVLKDLAARYPTKGGAFAICGADGRFECSYFRADDGCPPGKYVAAIAKLQLVGANQYRGPDQLNNLYNDPEKNVHDPRFVIDHRAPGKTDYHFDLKLVGIAPVMKPGPRAITAFGSSD
jgi:hypothetical protein